MKLAVPIAGMESLGARRLTWPAYFFPFVPGKGAAGDGCACNSDAATPLGLVLKTKSLNSGVSTSKLRACLNALCVDS